MKKFVSVLGSILLVTSFTVPSTASTEYEVSQKTLAAFVGSTTILTSQQKAQIKAAVEENPSAEKFICTGIRFESAPMSENIVVRKRAKAACDYAKTLNPELSTFFQNKPTKARSFAGKVLLTVKTPLAASSPTPTSTPTPADLSSHPSITDIGLLSPIEVCKTSDVSFRSDASNGFPRPSSAKTGTVSARILLLPVVFSDLPYTEADDQRIRAAANQVSRFYDETSYGKVSMTYEYVPKQYWVTMTKSMEDYRPYNDRTFVVEDVFALADPSINFSLYDGVALTTGNGVYWGAAQGFPGVFFPTKNGVVKGVTLEMGLATGSYDLMAHELGHSLFGLEDLYVFQDANRPSVPDPRPAGPWDIMGIESSGRNEFFGWNKLLMGWLDSDQVRCLTTQASSSHYIESIDQASNNPKLILINLSEGVTLAIEGRSSPSKGVLIYKIDTRINHGDGPITAQKSLLASGQQLTLDGWTVKVNAINESGFLVDVTRG